MANNCGKCLSLNEKYQCGWCQATEQCEVNTQCGASDEEEVSWMNRNETCPNHLRTWVKLQFWCERGWATLLTTLTRPLLNMKKASSQKGKAGSALKSFTSSPLTAVAAFASPSRTLTAILMWLSTISFRLVQEMVIS